jgi:acyl-coenzyme A thioesterase PaaI-like protein
MSTDVARMVDSIRRYYDEGCFACGRDNPIGLHLDEFRVEDGAVSARFDPRDHYRGAGTTLHGGVAATALDEMLVWAGLLIEEVLTVTGSLEIRYRRPVHVDESIIVSAHVDERRGRRLKMSGMLTVNGETRVEGSGLYLVSAALDDLLD